MKTQITDLQEAKIIIDEVGERYQSVAVDMLESLTHCPSQYEPEKTAQELIKNITNEYALNLANILLADKREEIAQKTWVLDEGEE